MFRRLLVDPLEERVLLSVSPMNVDDRMITEGPGTWQYTAAGRSLAADHDGDFVVVWTRFDELVERDPLTGDPIIDPDTGEPIPIIDPYTGLPPVDPETGFTLTDANIYARYFTDEVQRITVPAPVLENIDPANDVYGTFSLAYGGPEVQKISITATYEPFTYSQSSISGTFTLGFDANGNGVIDSFDPGPAAQLPVTSAAPESSLIFATDDLGAEGVQVVFEDSGSGTVTYDEVAKTLTFGITAGATTAADIIAWLEASPAAATFSAELDPANMDNDGTGNVEDTDLFNPPALSDEGGTEASTTVVFSGTDNDLVFRATAPLPAQLGTEIQFGGIPGFGPATFAYAGPGSPLIITYDSDGTTAQEIVDGLAADVGLAGTNFTAALDLADGVPYLGTGAVDPQTSAPMPAPGPPVPAETTEPIPYDEFVSPELNAAEIELALRNLDEALGSGTALADLTVEALNYQEFLVHFSEATSGQDQPQMVATEFDFAAGFFGGAFLPAVQTSTVHEQILIPGIPVSPNDPARTAIGIEQRFLQTSETFPVGPIEFYPPGGTPPNGPYNFGPEAMRTALPRVSVTPVSTAEGDLWLRQFDITFVGGDGPYSGDSGKMDHPPLVIWDVKDGTGTVRQWPLPTTNPILLEQVAETLKEPSGEFRVNPPEPDDPFTVLPDVFNQINPAVAMDADGDFVIVWESEIPNSENFGSVSDVFARRFSPAGVVQTPEFVQGVRLLEAPSEADLYRVDDYTFRVNKNTANPQFEPHVGMDDDGNFTIAWAEGGQDLSFFNGIRARRFDREGVPLGGEWLVNREDTAIHFEPFVGMSADGHFAITWTRTDDPDYLIPAPYFASVQAEVYDLEGVTLVDQFPVGGAGGGSAAFDLDNNFVIAWDVLQSNDNIPGTRQDVYARMFELYLDEIQILTITPDVPGFPIQGYFQLAVATPDGDLSTNSILFKSSDMAGVTKEIEKALSGLGFKEVTVVVVSTPDEYAFEISFRGDRPGVDQPDLKYVAGSLAATGAVATVQDAGIGDTGTPIRDTFRVNSPNFDPSAKTLWPYGQANGHVGIDSDGDLTVVYEGFGPDVTEDLYAPAAYFTEVMSRPENEDLVDYFPLFGLPASFMYNSGDTDSVIEEVLIDAGSPVSITTAGAVDVQTLTFDAGGSTPLTGTFDLEIDDATGHLTTAPIAFDDSDLAAVATSIQTALEAVSPDFAGVAVTVVSPFDPYQFQVDFSGAVAPPTGLMQANSSWLTDQQLGRLRAIMDEVATLLRGEANGVMYSQFDADPDLGTLNILSGDNVVNAHRDGHNTRYLIALDAIEVKGGYFTVTCAGQNVDIPVAFQGGFINTGGTAGNINGALDGLGSTGVNWPEYEPGFYERPVDVRVVYTSELLSRTGTPWEIPSYYIDPTVHVVFEVTFQGEVHDQPITLSLAQGGNHLTGEEIAEVQAISFQGQPDMTGWFALQIGDETLPDIWMPDISAGADPLGDLQAIASAIEGGLTNAGYDGTTVAFFPNPPPDETAPPYTFVVTFGEAGEDQPDITLVAAQEDHGDDPTLTAGLLRVTDPQGGVAEAPPPIFVMHTYGDAGTEQARASIGMQTDGSFVVAWSESVSGFYDDAQIFFRQFHEDTDTAGPRVADLVAPDGTRTADGGRFPTTDGLQHMVLTFDEELLVEHDVATQLEILGIDPADASEDLLRELARRFQDSATNPDNYELLLNGALVGGATVDVQFGMNMAAELAADYGLSPVRSNKWEAVLTFDGDTVTPGLQPLAIGSYQIRVLHPIPASATQQGQSGLRDKAGNPLGHTGFQDGGTDFSRTFNVVIGEGPGGPGDPDPNTEDQPVNATQVGDQSDPSVAIDADGDYVVVWTSTITVPDPNADPTIVPPPTIDQTDILAQVFNSLGQPEGPEFIVSSYETGNQIDPDVAMDERGNFVVTWSGEGEMDTSGVFVRRFDMFGRPRGDQFRVNQFRQSIQNTPSVAMDPNGDFVVTWTGYGHPDDDRGVYARRYNAFGHPLGDEFRVNTTTVRGQENSDVATDADGNFVVVWASWGQDGGGWGIFGRRYNTAGQPRGGEFRLNNYTVDDQLDPRVSMDENGNFVATWASFLQDGSNYGVYARRYNFAGAPRDANEFRVNQTTKYAQRQPAVGMSKNGDFTVVWTTYDQDDEDSRDDGIYARMYLSDGSDFIDEDAGLPLGEFQVNATTPGNQVTPAVARDTDSGDYAVVWAGPGPDGTEIFSRLLDPPAGGPYDPGGDPSDGRDAVVKTRHVFYNNSAWDTNNPAANTLDDGAIAAGKTALLSGQTATFANYTSYDRGINGIMVDVADLAGTPTAADFVFKVGNDNEPAGWSTVTSTPTVAVRPGHGIHGSSRVTITWNDNVIQNQWLQVTVLANNNTGLAEEDVFYFGNAIGESGNSTADAQVTTTDLLLARNNQRNSLDPAPVHFSYDYNRDQQVNTADVVLAWRNQTSFLNALKLIDLPGLESAGEGSLMLASAGQDPGPPTRNADTSFDRMDWLYEFDECFLGSQSSDHNGVLVPQAVDEILTVYWP